jgi:hypothetical protein
MPKVIPLRIFQTLALLALPTSVGLALYWWLTDQGMYQWIGLLLGSSPIERLFAVTATIIINLLIVLALILGLRPFTQNVPPFGQHTSPPSATPSKIQAQGIASALITLGMVFATIGVASLPTTANSLFRWQIIFILAGLIMGVWGIVKLFR